MNIKVFLNFKSGVIWIDILNKYKTDLIKICTYVH